MVTIKDSFGRELHYLRISVTDRCNLRCRYCMPEDGVRSVPHGEVLSFDEITRLVRIMAGLGVSRVRLTGGEPLVRKDIPHLASQLRQVEGVDFLGLTTNGVLLEPLAEELLAAGVSGLNISLDTTDPARYIQMTRRDEYARARRGIDKALSLPFSSVKINCVLAPESNAADWTHVAALARTLPVDVRLIEWMPMADETGISAVTVPDVLSALTERFGTLTPLGRVPEYGPASYYQVAGFKGKIGVIPAMSHNFCASCNRLRLTATGDLMLCLFSGAGLPLKPLIRGGASDDDIANAIKAAVRDKPERHHGRRENAAATELPRRPGGMYGIGG